jgi:hypothetical protein
MTKTIRMIVVCAVLGGLFLTGCATFTSFLSPHAATSRSATVSRSAAAPAKGETASITGKLEKEKNAYVLTDAKTGVSYRFVGLKKSGEAQLSPYVGKSVTVKLKVKSTESAKVNIAELIAIVK